jgi:hypothetical protein
MNDRLTYSVRKFAEANDLNPQTVRNAIYAKKLVAIRLWDGGELRIPVDTIVSKVREELENERREQR